MKKVSRRGFMKAGGLAAAVATSEIAFHDGTAQAQDATVDGAIGRATLPYPAANILENVSEMTVGEVRKFSYPDQESPCLLIKTGQPAPGGIGPDNDIVAFSSMCSHQGCPLRYDAEERTLQCRCHFSIFDPEMAGQMVCGQATVNQPQILLEYDEEGDAINAVAVKGLLYGRQANIL